MSIILKNRLKNIFIFVFVVIASILILSFFHLNFNLDEEYSMGLIEHSYSHILSINLLDVHPATYYLCLKTFVLFSTFWTKSFFVKVFSARTFSIICYILLFIVLHKLTIAMNFKINWKSQLIVYSLIPVIGYYATDIRMYEFYALFNALMYYQLVLFDNTQIKRHLILSIIFTLISLYIDYFSGFCSCIFLLEYFIKYLVKRNFKDAMYIFYAGIVTIIFSIPLIILGLKQILLRTSSGLSTSINFKYSILDSFTQMNNPSLIRVIPCCVFLLIPIIDIIHNRFEYKALYERLMEVLINYVISLLLLLSLLLCFKTEVFEPKVMYAQFTIYMFLIVSMIVLRLSKMQLIKHLDYLFILLMLLMLPIARIYSNYKSYIKIMPVFYRTIKTADYSKNRTIYLDYSKIPNNEFTSKSKSGKYLYITQESVYLYEFNKKLVVKNCYNGSKRASNNLVTGNTKLFKRNFNNLKFNKYNS